MFLSRHKKNNVYPCKPQFYYIKVGFKGSNLYRHVFMMDVSKCLDGMTNSVDPVQTAPGFHSLLNPSYLNIRD